MKLSELLIEPEVTLELAPLIDVLFLIVLFYAVSSSLISPEDLARLKGQLATAATENRTLLEHANSQEAVLSRLQADLAQSTRQAATQSERVARLEAELQAGAAQVTRYEGEIAGQREQIGRLQGDLVTASASLGDHQTRLAEQAQQLTRVQAELDSKEQALAAQAQRIVVMNQSLDDVRAGLAQSQASVDQQTQRATAAQAALTRLEAESKTLAADLSREQAAHQADQAEAQAELERLRVQVTELSSENARYQTVKKAELDRAAGIEETQQRLAESLKSLIEDKSLGVQRVNDRLVLELSDRILFDSGSEQLRSEGLPVLANVARILASRVHTIQIQVGGHTDNIPLGPGSHFGSNWALSAARAVNVVRFLEQTGGIEPNRLAAVGYGEFQPIASNATPEGRTRNRRIEIVLLAQ
jgi:chemotaxis protein MotB